MEWGGALSASAQTPRTGVVIRERVEVQPPVTTAARASRPAACSGPVVGYAVYRPGHTSDSVPLIESIGRPLDATLSVTTECGTYDASLVGAYVLIDEGPYPFANNVTWYRYEPVDGAEILRVPLHRNETVISATYTAVDLSFTVPYPSDFTAGDDASHRMGCSQSNCQRSPPGAVLFTYRTTEGFATEWEKLWPEEVSCGSTTSLAALGRRADGAEGYVAPQGLTTMDIYSGPGTVASGSGSVTAFGSLPSTVREVVSGGVRFVAPACGGGFQPAVSQVYLVGGIGFAGGPITITSTPGALAVTADPDTVAAGGEVRFAVDAPGLAPETPVTLSVPDLTLGGFVPDGPVARRGSGERVASVTRTLADVGNVRFVAADDVLVAAAVTVTAAGGGRTGTVAVTVLPPPIVDWLTVQDSTYTRDYLFVSRFPTDQRFPRDERFITADFNSTVAEDLPTAGASGGDAFTVRPRLNMAGAFGEDVDCSHIQFHLRVLRNGTPVEFRSGDDAQGVPPTEYEYGADWASRAEKRGECRSKRFIRFVSNAPPGAGGSPGTANQHGGTYDDEFGGSRTVRVQLGDSVVVWAVATIGGRRDTTAAVSLPIGAPGADLTDPFVPARVNVHWAVPAGGTAAPDVVTDRMSEDVAQAGIRFNLAPSVTPYTPVQNTFRLRLPSATGSDPNVWRTTVGGTVGATVTLDGGATWSADYTYAANVSFLSVARGLLAALAAQSGGVMDGNVSASATSAEIADAPDLSFVLLLAKGRDFSDIAPRFTGGDVRAELFPLNYGHLYGPMAAAAAMNFRDGDRETMDVVALGANALFEDATNTFQLNGSAYPRDAVDVNPNPAVAERLTPINTVLLDGRAADAADDLPSTAGHEAAHVLLNGAYAGAAGTGAACDEPDRHDLDPTNLVACGGASLTGVEGYGYHKRLTQAQAEDIRTDHGPSQDPSEQGLRPRLLRPF